MRILFITSTRIGDAALSTGLLGWLLDCHPGARVTVAAGPLAAPIFEAVPGLERLIVMRKRGLARHWIELWRRTAARRWDLVVDLRASVIAYALVARERRVIGRRSRTRLHRVEELAQLFGLETPPALRLWLAQADIEAAEEALSGTRTLLALAPTANWRGKQWPGERFAELALRLTGREGPLPGATVAVLGGPDERPQAARVLEAIPDVRRLDLFGRGLGRAAAILSRADLFVGNDSGLMHLAAAGGAPTLGLFGPSPDWRYRPWSEKAAIVRTPESFEELSRRVQRMNADERRDADGLMSGLSVEAVEAAARRLLEGAQESGSAASTSSTARAPRSGR